MKLKKEFFFRDQLLKDSYPSFIKELIQLDTLQNKNLMQGLISCIYGRHLLDLDLIEGFGYVLKGIKEIWLFGHYNKAITYKGFVQSWLKDRGHLEKHNIFIKKSLEIQKHQSLPLELEIENLYKSHQYFVEGDYYTAEKVLRNQLANASNEAIEVHFVSLIVNNASKLNIETDEQIQFIDKTLNDLNFLEDSILKAQLYVFKSIVNKNDINFQKAVKAFKRLDIIEDFIMHSLNRFSNASNLSRLHSTEVSEERWKDLFGCKALLNKKIWIKNRFALFGKLWQTLAQEYTFKNRPDKASQAYSKASDYLLDTNNLVLFANNLYLISLNLITIGRQKRDLNSYLEARKNLNKGLILLNSSGLKDFIWRPKFGLALTYYEPLVRSLVEKEDYQQFCNRGDYYFNLAKSSSRDFFNRELSQINSKDVRFIIALKRDFNQLIFSGFFFYLHIQKFTKCITWLEEFRTRFLLTALTKNSIPLNGVQDHPLIKEEIRLTQKISQTKDIEEKKSLQTELKSVYKKMKDDSFLVKYAKKKLKITPSYEEITSLLYKEETSLQGRNLFFIYYYVLQEDIYVFGIGSKQQQPSVKKIPISLNELKVEYDEFLFELALAKQENSNEHNLSQFSEIIKPIKEWTHPDDLICIVPYGILQNFPFHILSIDNQPLIQRNPVFYNSSFTNWSLIASFRTGKNPISNPYLFGKPDKDLEKSKEEVMTIASLLSCEYHIGQDASKSKFLEACNEGSLIHFAGHGLYDQSKGFLSVLTLSDKKINAEEIMDLHRIPDFVVLSSCDTALQKNYEGEEQVGLIPAFLSAGASSVLAGMWPVGDNDAKEFFSQFYQKLKNGIPKVIAYQQTVKHLMSQEKTSNFYSWGMFALIGDWK